MKLKLDLHGVIFEYEKKPMHPARFRRLCTLLAAALYVALVIGVTRLCGFLGLLVIAVVTPIMFAIETI